MATVNNAYTYILLFAVFVSVFSSINEKKSIELLRGLNEITAIQAINIILGTKFNKIGCYYLNIIDSMNYFSFSQRGSYLGPLTGGIKVLCFFKVIGRTVTCLHKNASLRTSPRVPDEVPKFTWSTIPLSPQFQSGSDDLFISAGAKMPSACCR